MPFQSSSLTQLFNGLLRRGAKDNIKKVLDDMIEEAQAWKPSGYDADQRRRRDYYEGKHSLYLRNALRKRYPGTWSDMSQISLNLTKMIADIDSSVYDQEPSRSLERNGEDVPSDSPQGQAFESIYENAAINVTLAEAERRLMVSNTMFLRVAWDQMRSHPKIEMFYPSDVHVIPHPNAPTDLSASIAILSRIVSENGVNDKVKKYEVWHREFEDSNGQTNYGPWRVEHWDTDGKSTEIFPDNLWPLEQLPWVIWRNGVSDGTIYRDVDRDLLDTIDAIAVGMTNIQFTIDMQAHSQLAYEGDSREDLAGGPGKILTFAPGENLSVLNYDPKLVEMERSSQNLIKSLAATRRQSPDAYSIEREAPQSGVARKIQNLPYTKALRERSHFARDMEQDLFRVLIAFSDSYGTGTKIGSENLTLKWSTAKDPEFEDQNSKTARIAQALDMGLISKERAAVDLGYYSTESEAAEAFASQAEARQDQVRNTSIAERLRLIATGS